MNKRKQLLIALSLICGFIQAPSAEAQAEVLVGIGAKLIPVLIPLTLSVLPAVPTLVNQMMHPLPRVGRRKKSAEQEESASADKTEESADSEASKEKAEAEEESREERAARRRAAQESAETAVAARRHVKPADNSEWFLDDDEDLAKAQPVRTAAKPSKSSEQSSERSGERSTEFRATKDVNAKIINEPAKTQAKQTKAQAEQVNSAKSSSTAPKEEAAAKETHEETASSPVIMMKVSD